jgi:hypothetical protein
MLLERRVRWDLSLCADSVSSKKDLALTQCPESNALSLKHRLFRDPKSEEFGCTLILSCLHNHGVLGGGKKALGKFRNLYLQANSFEIHSNLLPL